MHLSKTENRETPAESKAATKKSRLKRLAIWVLIDLTVASFVLILLLFYRPGRYDPLSPAGFKAGQVSPYLTLFHADVYNGAQLEEPFDVEMTQEGLNDIIARGGLDWNWPLESEGVMLYAPAAVLENDAAALMATANIKGFELIVTIELVPEIDDKGLLTIKVGKMKIGAGNVTPIAKIMARRSYAEQLAAAPVDQDAWQTKIVASLLNDEPFDPVFPTGKKNLRVRVGKIAVHKGKLTFQLIPLP